ncbi:hypothetical protein CALVIDRAFT_336797 [Calocera viscosa TUFC12733]|uniref:Uncharacterized protein n=1 Tax=Calocera viscosa (strain TUFC12733) TaxID=1330018 RepID=A0A167HIY3_CALVF|nr:hypothetical protein CALVIDRAFT_336797 [Calocera viscosa TUFC12733]
MLPRYCIPIGFCGTILAGHGGRASIEAIHLTCHPPAVIVHEFTFRYHLLLAISSTTPLRWPFSGSLETRGSDMWCIGLRCMGGSLSIQKVNTTCQILSECGLTMQFGTMRS